jgi:hypothetical protein
VKIFSQNSLIPIQILYGFLIFYCATWEKQAIIKKNFLSFHFNDKELFKQINQTGFLRIGYRIFSTFCYFYKADPFLNSIGLLSIGVSLHKVG